MCLESHIAGRFLRVFREVFLTTKGFCHRLERFSKEYVTTAIGSASFSLLKTGLCEVRRSVLQNPIKIKKTARQLRISSESSCRQNKAVGKVCRGKTIGYKTGQLL